uniref:Uncharacterized protein n=1 Tax=Anguilla anguilla TaxID=7936 RepID=A0A0E9SUT0_ANGAN
MTSLFWCFENNGLMLWMIIIHNIFCYKSVQAGKITINVNIVAL